jgi:G:T-mismatch repair DNA endonuclease (very short patch repair protein)
MMSMWNYNELIHAGWQVVVIWECQLGRDEMEPTMQQVAVALNRNLLNALKTRSNRSREKMAARSHRREV